jgi:hypothetical protein
MQLARQNTIHVLAVVEGFQRLGVRVLPSQEFHKVMP